MALVECRSCKRTVIAKNDGSCPSCGAATAGAVVVPVTAMEPAEALAWSRIEEERRERRASARRLHDRGRGLVVGGIGLAVLGLALSVVSFLAAAGGGSYTVWTGAVIGGAFMASRGRGLVARARALEAE
jgi:hypothetical protein